MHGQLVLLGNRFLMIVPYILQIKMNKGLDLLFQYYLATSIKSDIHKLKEMTFNGRSDGPDLPKFHTVI